jgi:large subunit ribosomal protein L41
MDVKLTEKQKREVYGKLPKGGLTGLHYYEKQLWKREMPPEAIVEKKDP